MAGVGFESKQTENTPVTRIDSGLFSVRYAYSLSYERVTGNRASNDYLEWNASGDTLVFAMCDGVETSHASGLAARFLGHRLVEWLGALPASAVDDLEPVRGQLGEALAEWLPAAQRAVRSKVKAGEAIFTCGRISATPEGLRGFVAGIGLIYVRLYDRKGRDIGFAPLRHAYDRWSTLRGLRGQIFVEPVGPRPPLQRLILFTDGLSELEDKLAGYTEIELQSAILDSFQSVLNDDISLLDVQMCEQPVSGKPKKVVIGSNDLPQVRLERVDDSLEWELRDDTLHSILEMRDASGARVLGAGNFFSWRPPVERVCAYRVCLVSVAGRAYSAWLDWQPVAAEEMWDDEAAPEDAEKAPIEIDELEDFLLVEEALETSALTPEAVEPGGVEPAQAVGEIPAAEPPVMEEIPTPHVAEEPLPPPAPVMENAPEGSPEPVNPVIEEAILPVLPAPEVVEVLAPGMVEPETIRAETPEPLPTPDVTPEEPPAGQAPAEILLTPAASGVGPLAWLGKLPNISGLLRRTMKALGGKKPTNGVDSRTLPSGPWVEKGKYPGQYVLHWQASAGANEYEIWDQPLESADAGNFSRTSEARLRLEGLSTGMHRLHIRPVGLAFDVDWQAWPHSDLNVPAAVRSAPTNVRVESTPEEAELRLRWSAIVGELVEEYWIFEVGREEHRLIGKVGGDGTRFSLRKTPSDRARRFVVRGINWGGLGPVSEAAVYQPGASPASEKRPTARSERATQPQPTEQRIAQIPEMCEVVNRWVRSQNVQMSSMKLEQRYENADQYLLLENRRLGQLTSLSLIKGPEYRLTVYGTRGEVSVIEIRFEKRSWTFLVKFLPVLRRGSE